MKMTWLHKFFGLFFIPADGQAKSVQQLISTVLQSYLVIQIIIWFLIIMDDSTFYKIMLI